MEENDILKCINFEILKPIVVKALDNDSIEIINWSSQNLKGGTVGEVFLIKGICIDNTVKKANLEENTYVEWSVILKVLKAYTRFGDPESWNREVQMYQSEIFNNLTPNIRVPKCLGISNNKTNEVWLWMEYVEGVTNDKLSLENYEMISRHIGEFQGIYFQKHKRYRQVWLSTEFLVTSYVIYWGTDAVAWILKNEMKPEKCKMDSEILRKAIQLWREKDKLIEMLNKLPKTLCHRDFNPANIVVDGTEKTILFDWDCTGIGVLGEDVADLLVETLVFYDYDTEKASELREIILSGYLIGLDNVGWQGNIETVKLGFDLVMVLHWTFRIISKIQYSRDINEIKKYSQILYFILEKVDEVRQFID